MTMIKHVYLQGISPQGLGRINQRPVYLDYCDHNRDDIYYGRFYR